MPHILTCCSMMCWLAHLCSAWHAWTKSGSSDCLPTHRPSLCASCLRSPIISFLMTRRKERREIARTTAADCSGPAPRVRPWLGLSKMAPLLQLPQAAARGIFDLACFEPLPGGLPRLSPEPSFSQLHLNLLPLILLLISLFSSSCSPEEISIGSRAVPRSLSPPARGRAVHGEQKGSLKLSMPVAFHRTAQPEPGQAAQALDRARAPCAAWAWNPLLSVPPASSIDLAVSSCVMMRPALTGAGVCMHAAGVFASAGFGCAP